MNPQKLKIQRRERRHRRVRRKVSGTPERPRLCVYRSLAHMYCQVIDDISGHTLVSASSKDVEFKDSLPHGGNIEAAKTIGKRIAEKAKEKGIERVVFDRGSYPYHGRVKALAEAAREAGMKF